MRISIGVWLLFASAFAQADRLITIPTAHRLANKQIYLEGDYSVRQNGLRGGTAEIGFFDHYELGWRGQNYGLGDGGAAFDFSYNLLSPIADFAPGLSLGVLDGANATPDGRQFYLCATFGEPVLPYLQHLLYAQTTIGLEFGSRLRPFFGFTLPLGTNLRLLAEHNGFRPSLALEFRPIRAISFRIVATERGGAVTLGLTKKL